MIDTYMDRADTLCPRIPEKLPPGYQRPADNPCFWGGFFFDTPSAARAAAARAKLGWALLTDCVEHGHEMRHGIRMGSVHSVFTKEGKRK